MKRWPKISAAASDRSARVEQLPIEAVPLERLSTDYLLVEEDDYTSSFEPKYRSDLAFAAGFTALACVLFRFSLIPAIFDLARNEVIPYVLFLVALLLPGLPAPFALWLGMAARSDLRHHRGKSGWVPATLGVVIGFLGTLILLSEIYQVTRALWAIRQS